MATSMGAGPQHSAAAEHQQIFLTDELCNKNQGLKDTDDQILPAEAGENQERVVIPTHPVHRGVYPGDLGLLLTREMWIPPSKHGPGAAGAWLHARLEPGKATAALCNSKYLQSLHLSSCSCA